MLKRIAVLAVSLALFAAPARAACNGFAVPNFPFAFESITVSNSAIGFTTATYNPSTLVKANYAICTTETNPLRFRADGTNPTAAIGHLVSAGQSIEVCGTAAVAAFRFIRQGAADATAMCSYYRGE